MKSIRITQPLLNHVSSAVPTHGNALVLGLFTDDGKTNAVAVAACAGNAASVRDAQAVLPIGVEVIGTCFPHDARVTCLDADNATAPDKTHTTFWYFRAGENPRVVTSSGSGSNAPVDLIVVDEVVPSPCSSYLTLYTETHPTNDLPTLHNVVACVERTPGAVYDVQPLSSVPKMLSCLKTPSTIELSRDVSAGSCGNANSAPPTKIVLNPIPCIPTVLRKSVLCISSASTSSLSERDVRNALERQAQFVGITAEKTLSSYSAKHNTIAIEVTTFVAADGLCSVPLTLPVVTTHSAANRDTMDQSIRKRVHDVFLLPPRRVLLRADCVVDAVLTSNGNTLIATPHRHVTNPKPIDGGIVFATQGRYDYYHYLCDGFDDKGWGCAYRSCQTVLSWFFHRGYLDRIPSLREIQLILKEVDPDKQKKANFVGSKEWIGSFEVSMVLGYLLPSVQCKLHHCATGSELDTSTTVMRTLQHHFTKVGCPVMIGGHHYAHTILGIDFDAKMGRAMYLILDPHYPAASSDVDTMVKKGWCAWKQAKGFFDDKSFYNLCLPVLPSGL
eukprot:PhM_4_TR16016/c0_g1_i1/m.469/K01376/UFSP2; UFM1-specific protease 2